MTIHYKRIGLGEDKNRFIAQAKANSNLSPKPTETCLFYSLDAHIELNPDTQLYEATVEVVWVEKDNTWE